MASQTASTWMPAACRRSARDRVSGSTGMGRGGGSSARTSGPGHTSTGGTSSSSSSSLASVTS
eukprot:3217308-Alexandrium_andersonii.AAC.1